MKVRIAFVLGLCVTALALGEPRLVVREYPIVTDPNLIPARDTVFAALVDTVIAQNSLARRPDDSTAGSERERRVFFRQSAPLPQTAWTAHTRNGARWTARQTGSLMDDWNSPTPRLSWERIVDSLAVVDSAYARVAKSWDRFYTLERNDTVVRRFTTSMAGEPDFARAFVAGDSAIVEFIAPGHKHHVLVNGVDVNAERGYDECFGVEMLVGRPFWFYSRDGRFGWFYNGTEFDEGYSQILHDEFGAAAAYNPLVTPRYFRAYAQRGGTWFLLDGRLEEK